MCVCVHARAGMRMCGGHVCLCVPRLACAYVSVYACGTSADVLTCFNAFDNHYYFLVSKNERGRCDMAA